MSLKSFRRLNFGDSTTFSIQNNVNDFIRQIQNIPFLNGYLFEEVELQAGNNSFNNSFRKVLQGFLILNINASSSIYLVSSSESEIILNSSAPCTINLWVF